MLFSDSKTNHPLESTARKLRLDILDMIKAAGEGHIGGALSSLDLIAAVYLSAVFNLDKDRFILSNGHVAPALYAVLLHLNYLPSEKLNTYAQFGSPLQGHVSIDFPGVNYSGGSLGQGLSFAAGLAYGDPKSTAICLTSDGEHNEGQIWEAAMFANKYHLGNLINIVDLNGLQIDGTTDDIMPLGELAAKYVRFGWTVTTVDGHNYFEIIKALNKAKNTTIYPSCIIAKTTLGKGISFMENNFKYHDMKDLDDKLFQRAVSDLNSLSNNDKS